MFTDQRFRISDSWDAAVPVLCTWPMTNGRIDVALRPSTKIAPTVSSDLRMNLDLAELSHPNLVDLHDLHHDNNTWFFTMEYVDGVDLMEWVRPYNQNTDDFELDLLRLRGTFEQLAAGLSALHTSGHLHRDIKPSNLLVQRDGRVVILDFGLATRVDQVDIRDIRGFSGTLEYMAPEQSEGRDPVPASDWYSFGCVLFQALTGQLPFRGKPLQVALLKRQQDGPAPSTIHGYPKTWTHSVRHCYAETRRLVQTRKRSLNA